MAGKTLPGIGEDESGEHEAADRSDSALRTPTADKSDSSLRPSPVDKSDSALRPSPADKSDSGIRADKTPSSRPTDRMPMGVSATKTIMYSGGAPIIDEDKVAEGLKKLRSLDEPLGARSLDEPLGAIPSTMPTVKEGIPTLKEGIPAITDEPALTPVKSAGISVAELLRSRGTAHGHALSTPGSGQNLMPVAVDDRLKGTLLGHSLHLPDLPTPSDENRSAEVRSIALATPAAPEGAAPTQEVFTTGDAGFFDSAPINTEMEPEHPRSTKVVRGVAIFAAVVSVFIVAAFAWVHSQKSDSVPVPVVVEPRLAAPEPAPAPAPAVLDTTVVPVTATAGAAAAPAPAAAIPPVAIPAPSPAAEEAPKATVEEAPESPSAKLKREVAAAAAASVPKPAATHHSSSSSRSPSSRPSSSSSPSSSLPSSSRQVEAPRAPAQAARPASVPGKRGKTDDDPDGTLPLSE